jgi:hypothetical protein
MLKVESCPTCGSDIHSDFCPQCGERRPSARIYTLREFAHEAFETFTNVERSFLKTLKTLIRKPGELTAAYMRGERVRHLRPLQLFLLVNVLYFFVAGPAVTVYSTPLYNHLTRTSFREKARRIVDERRAREDMTLQQYETAFNEKTGIHARSLVIVMAPAFALAVGLLGLGRRRPAVQHLVFSVHFYSFLLLLTLFVAWPVVLAGRAWRGLGGKVPAQTIDPIIGAGFAVGIVVFLIPAFRRAYGDGRIGAVLKALLGLAAVILILSWYRKLLFYVTAYSL